MISSKFIYADSTPTTVLKHAINLYFPTISHHPQFQLLLFLYNELADGLRQSNHLSLDDVLITQYRTIGLHWQNFNVPSRRTLLLWTAAVYATLDYNPQIRKKDLLCYYTEAALLMAEAADPPPPA